MTTISIYILCYNEETLLAFSINHYRRRFPNAFITVLDNYSTDNSVKIARELGCDIYQFNTNNQISDLMYQYLKNEHWKQAKTDWVLICDCDELLCIDEAQLLAETHRSTTIIRSEGHNMISMNDDLNLEGVTHGFRNQEIMILYDKHLLFDRTKIVDMNYNVGAHGSAPSGHVKYSADVYKLLHYKYISPDYLVNRYKMYRERLSQHNLDNSYGGQYLHPEVHIRAEFDNYRKIAQKII